MRQLNEEQLRRLADFAEEYGPKWKTKLMAMWMNGADANQPDGHLLRQVRNTVGPGGLQKLKLPS